MLSSNIQLTIYELNQEDRGYFHNQFLSDIYIIYGLFYGANLSVYTAALLNCF